MAAQGSEMIAADSTENAVGAAGESVSQGSANPFDLNGDGQMSPKEIMKMAKENKLPGIDLSDPKYADVNGWTEFKSDLMDNEQFIEMLRKYSPRGQRRFLEKVGLEMAGEVAEGMGGEATFHGNSWFQRFIGADPSAAENAAKEIARAMGNNI